MADSEIVVRAEITFHVAPNGQDAWSGKLAAPNSDGTDGPFATLVRARQAARKVIEGGLTEPLTVLVRGGKYFLEETFVLRRKTRRPDVQGRELAAESRS